MKLRALLVVAFALLASSAWAQTTFTLRAQWEIEGPAAQPGQTRPPFDVVTAQSYVYKMYVVGSAVGTTLTGVACTTTADQFIKTCAATLPSQFDQPGIQVDMTATVDGIETVHSSAATVPPQIIPPTPPSNLRLIRIAVPAANTAKPTTPTK